MLGHTVPICITPLVGQAAARGMVRRAVAELPVRRRALIGTLFGEAEVRYADVSRVLDIPPGSIGPTRGRVLRMLRQALEQDGLTEGSVA